jgi:hypothetical protein
VQFPKLDLYDRLVNFRSPRLLALSPQRHRLTVSRTRADHIRRTGEPNTMDTTPALANGGTVTGPGRLVDGTDCLIPCPYCSRPEEWDACPIHRDGQDQTVDED